MIEQTEIDFLVNFRKAKTMKTLEIMARAAIRKATTRKQQLDAEKALAVRTKEIDVLNGW